MEIPIKTRLIRDFLSYFLGLIYGPSDREFVLAISKVAEKNSLLLKTDITSFLFNGEVYKVPGLGKPLPLHISLRKDMRLLVAQRDIILREQSLIKNYLSVVLTKSLNLGYIFMHLPDSLSNYKDTLLRYINRLETKTKTESSCLFLSTEECVENKDYYIQVMSERLLFNLIKGIS